MTEPETPSPTAARILERFRDRVSDQEPALCFAPGRVNLLGAHLDYSGGDVLPIAVDLGVYVAARLRRDRRVRLESLDQPSVVEVDVDDLGERAAASHGWAGYVLGVCRFFGQATGITAGADLVFGGDLPIASGVSSSAAIEVATAFALDHLHSTRLGSEELARIAHRAETSYVGVHCGIMDQFASALGRAGHALLLHCRDGSYEHVPMDGSGFEVLLMDTRKPRPLAGSMFNDRVRECAEAHAILRERVRVWPFLAAYDVDDVEAAAAFLAGVRYRRARHVVTEMARITAGVAALRCGDIAALGRAIDASHRSTAEDYDVSCAELDAITDAARECAGVFGARLTGAGFGGCAIALVAPGAAEQVISHVGTEYRTRFGIEPGFRLLHAGAGPRIIRGAGG